MLRLTVDNHALTNGRKKSFILTPPILLFIICSNFHPLSHHKTKHFPFHSFFVNETDSAGKTFRKCYQTNRKSRNVHSANHVAASECAVETWTCQVILLNQAFSLEICFTRPYSSSNKAWNHFTPVNQLNSFAKHVQFKQVCGFMKNKNQKVEFIIRLFFLWKCYYVVQQWPPLQPALSWIISVRVSSWVHDTSQR